MQHARYPEVPDDFGHWLAGFIDGEGSFLIARTPRGSFRPHFRLVLRADDRAIVEEMVNQTGLGRAHAARAYGYRTRAKPQVIWCIDGKRENARLVELLDRFPPRAKKARDYAIWREAVTYWVRLAQGPGRAGQRGFETYDWGPIPMLRERIMAVRRFDSETVPITHTPPASRQLDLRTL